MNNVPLGNFKFSSRTYNFLRRIGVETISQLFTQNNHGEIKGFRGASENTLEKNEASLEGYRIEEPEISTTFPKDGGKKPLITKNLKKSKHQ